MGSQGEGGTESWVSELSYRMIEILLTETGKMGAGEVFSLLFFTVYSTLFYFIFNIIIGV